MCGIAKISRNAYYDYLRGPTSKEVSDNLIVDRIRQVQEETFYGYVYRPMKTLLNVKFGIDTNENHVLLLMRKNGLLSCVRRRKHSEEVYARRREMRGSAPPDLIRRDFFSLMPGTRFLQDITYLPVIEGNLYMNTVEDLYNGEARAWSISDHPNTRLCVDTVLKLASELGTHTTGVIVHSDAGTTYLSFEYRMLLAELGVLQSMGERGDVYDNAAMEALNGIIKTECLYCRFGKTKVENHQIPADEMIPVVEAFMQRYNTERLKEALGYLSPVRFRELNPKGKYLMVIRGAD